MEVQSEVDADRDRVRAGYNEPRGAELCCRPPTMARVMEARFADLDSPDSNTSSIDHNGTTMGKESGP